MGGYDEGMEAITLTDEQARAVAEKPEGVLLRDAGTNREYVLVAADVFARLLDGPWTAEERDVLAWEAGKHADWDAMDEYDDYPDKP